MVDVPLPTYFGSFFIMKVIASPNIALIKYWGKDSSTTEKNIPLNPSLSMTLSKAQTQTEFYWLTKDEQKNRIIFNQEMASASDATKVENHVKMLERELNLPHRPFYFASNNNFPHSAGLASSASGFCALTYALIGESNTTHPLHKMSAWSRRGSGSAARSVSGPFMKWKNEAATLLPYDWKLRDTVIIFSTDVKKVSSTDGHRLALTSPLFEQRLKLVNQRLANVEHALEQKNIHALGNLIEAEALEMHAISLTSNPPVYYWNADTLMFLKALGSIKDRDFYFTIDAGPNIHLISERPIRKNIEQLLEQLGIQAQIWEDEAGYGPQLLSPTNERTV